MGDGTLLWEKKGWPGKETEVDIGVYATEILMLTAETEFAKLP